MGADVPLRRNRDYMLVWAGQGVSELGSQVSTVAYPLLVLALTSSPAKAGLVGLAATLPVPLLALPAGMLADHFDRKRLMLTCDAIRAAALAVLTIAVFSGGVAFGVVVAVAFVDGALLTVSFVTERGVLRRLVAPEQLSAAVAQNETAFYASSIVGPPLGGLLFAIARALPFLADAVSYAFSATATLLTRAGFQPDRTEPRGSLVAEFTSGLRWLWRRPLLRTCSLITAAINPTWRALYLLLVVLAKRHGASSSLIGVMFAIIAAAGLLGGLLASSRLASRVSVATAVRLDTWTMALLMPLLLIAQGTLFTAAIVALIEFPAALVNSAVEGFRGALAPEHMQGRVHAAAGTLSQSLGWAGPLVIGLALEHFSSTTSILLLCGWALLAALAATLLPTMRAAE
ncbi:MAG TPA: MFS transporter [Solirubrobacteraceae bacterium]|nr:MFS transporter [Solirubrobacteraceae bacterium]